MRMQSGCSEAVNSKIENTKMTSSLLSYRKSLRDMSLSLCKYVVEMVGGNLLNAKLVLWGALQEVEKRMKERKEGRI